MDNVSSGFGSGSGANSAVGFGPAGRSSGHLAALPLNQTGVIFTGPNGLDFLELRLGAVRIPDVTLRFREAQRIFDGLDIERIDLLSSLVVDDDAFFRNMKLKTFLSALVQVGLYDRLLRTQRGPDVLVGTSSGDSALLVAAGQISFENFVKSSEVLTTLKLREGAPEGATDAGAWDSGLPVGLASGFGLPFVVLQTPLRSAAASAVPVATGATGDFRSGDGQWDWSLPRLAGTGLTEYRAFVRAEDGGFAEVGQPVMELKKLLAEVVEHQAVRRFINIGPAAAISPFDYEQIAEQAGVDEVTIIDSIDLDPMLNWFWKQVRPASGFAQ